MAGIKGMRRGVVKDRRTLYMHHWSRRYLSQKELII